MHEEQFVLSELGRLYIDSRALILQLQAAQKRIAELEYKPPVADAPAPPDGA